MPAGHIRGYLDHYFAPHPSQELRELFMSRATLDFATGMVMLFEPIFLHSIGWSLPRILLLYCAVYVAYFFMLPLGGRICRRHGYEHTILFSTPFLVLWYLCFFSIPRHPLFAVLAVMSLVMHKILYFPGYHANFVTWSDGNAGGREISTMTAMVGLATTFAPVIGGMVAKTFGFSALFLCSAALILLSNLPLLRTPERFEPRPFPYAPALRRVFARNRLRRLLGYMGFGEEMLALVAWPVFLVIMVPDMITVGAVASFSMLVNVFITLYVGRVSDDGDKGDVIRTGTFYTGASWLVRIIVTGGFGAFLVDSFYRVSKNVVNVPLTAALYGDARRGQVMDDVVFFEMALSLGKIAAGLTAAALFATYGTWWMVFALGTAFTGLYALVRGDGARPPDPVPVAAVTPSGTIPV